MKVSNDQASTIELRFLQDMTAFGRKAAFRFCEGASPHAQVAAPAALVPGVLCGQALIPAL